MSRFTGRIKQGLRRSRTEEAAVDTEMRLRAAAALQECAESHAALFERAGRLRERAERLETEGTPSDSAQNRAERAEAEVATELAKVRTAFSEAEDSDKSRLAFDQEVEALYPALGRLFAANSQA